MVDAAERRAPLDGILVLDLSRVLAGPLATMVLADLGARVIKVEDPAGGDVTRSWSPPSHAGVSTYYLSINRRKESVAVDLKTPAGVELVRRWAGRADVLVENFLPGALDRMGLSIPSLRETNRRLVACTISGFGETGPLAGEPGFDVVVQAASGMMSITGPEAGEPQKTGFALCDVLTGWAAASGILAALRARDRDGVGAHVTTDLFSAALAGLVNVAEGALLTGEEARRYGNGHPSLEPYRPFRASDASLIVAVGSDRQWRALAAEVLELPDLAADARFATNALRVEGRESLVPLLQRVLGTRPREEWLRRCRRAGVPAGPVAGVLEALRSEQARSLGTVLLAGGVPTVHGPIRIAELPDPPATAPPRLDEHGEALWAEVGLTRPR